MAIDTSPVNASQIRPGSRRAWAAAARPRTLWVALSSVLVGTALSYARVNRIDPRLTLLVLACAVLMQVISNLQNDVGYTLRGGERSGNRTGLPRATARGWLSTTQVRVAIAVLAAVAVVLATSLIVLRGWPVIAIGAASLGASLAYMAGPRPIAYTPFGELTVFVFFGLVAVTGTDWVLSGTVGPATAAAAVAIGSLAAAALAVNNHRDIDHDRSVGRRTFAATFGARRSLGLFTTLLGAPFALVPIIAIVAHNPLLLLPLVLAPAAYRLRQEFSTCPPGVAFNSVLFHTFALELRYATLLAAGAFAARLLH